MNNELNNKKAKIFKALANPVRLKVIDLLIGGEKCVCEIVEELKEYEQPHISKSLSKLKEVGLIQDRKEGLNVYYSLRCSCMSAFFNCINELAEVETKKQ